MKRRDALSMAMNLSWTMLFSLLIPLLAGVWLDKKLGTVPLFIVIGAILGISAATIGVARMTIRTFGKATKTHGLLEEITPPGPGIDSIGSEVPWDQQTEANDKEGPA